MFNHYYASEEKYKDLLKEAEKERLLKELKEANKASSRKSKEEDWSLIKLALKTKPQSERKQIIIQLNLQVENKMPKKVPTIKVESFSYPQARSNHSATRGVVRSADNQEKIDQCQEEEPGPEVVLMKIKPGVLVGQIKI